MRQLGFQLNTWLEVKDGDATARSIFDGHYSRHIYADGRNPKLFVGPGAKMVLVTPEADALFVWRKFISGDGQQGVNCAVFRNESRKLSSYLILEAEKLAWARWPGQRLFTYVNPRKVRSTNPGYCFLRAGWRKCGITKWHKLLILEKCPLRDSENGAAERAEEIISPSPAPAMAARSIARTPSPSGAGARSRPHPGRAHSMANITLPTAYELFEQPRPPRRPHPDIIAAEKDRSESAEPAMEIASRECARLLVNTCLFDPPISDKEIKAYAERFKIEFSEAESQLREIRQ